MPIDMQGPLPVVSTKINGAEARFVLDSGGYFSIISDDAAARYHLQAKSVTSGSFYIRGVGGNERARIATVNSFEFIGIPVPKVRFLVVDQSFGDDYAGFLGQNVLRFSDVEYDLANGIVRFFKPVGCEKQPLAYWAVSTPYTTIDLQPVDSYDDHLRGTAMINGKSLSVIFDTGASRSYVSLEAAARAGITPDSAGATYLGWSGGIGPGYNKVWSATADTFQLGGEKVQHARLLISELHSGHRIGEVGDQMPDMLLGEDFFLSHRVYVSYGQRKLYFTYNGGPLFNLNLPDSPANTPKPAESPGATSQASAATSEQADADTPTDADGFRRRGMAYASRREFDRALADLTRACELAPKNADVYYDRGMAYAESGQFKPALQDFSTAIALRPDDIDTRLARVDLLELHPDTDPGAAPEIKPDLDAVARLAAPAAEVRLALADRYGWLGDYPAAIDQINLWIDHHASLPSDRVMGLNARCWWLAASNRDLHEAMQDCNHALDLAFDDANVRDSRGLVYLRMGDLNDAIQDYGLALRANPREASSLYGRGLAELLLDEKTQGQADVAAAEKLDSGIAKQFARMGLSP
jgi:tetratricopeptide (TPR) repeat protein/predicted aspartyl protease